MTQLAWSVEMATGVDALDEMHRDIFETMAGLASATDRSFSHCYGLLLGKLERAFATEEEWMEEIEHAGLKHHREQHARVLGALHIVHAQVLDNNIALGRKVVQHLLPQWLLVHIPDMDMPLAYELRVAGLPHARDAAARSSPATYVM